MATGWNRNADLAVEALKAHGAPFKGVPHYALGHSFGGVLTSLILGDQQTLFQRAVLLDPVLLTPAMLMAMSMAELTGMNKHVPLARQALKRRHHWDSREDAMAQLQGRGVYKGWATPALQAFVAHAIKDAPQGGVELKCQPQREAEIFSTGPDRLWSLLGRVRTPTLVLHATHTFPFVTESLQRWQQVNDAVQGQAFKGGHCFMQERPEDAAQCVQDFLLG
jgi:pimeloyl-ACP methyl ester carboxylesterase